MSSNLEENDGQICRGVCWCTVPSGGTHWFIQKFIQPRLHNMQKFQTFDILITKTINVVHVRNTPTNIFILKCYYSLQMSMLKANVDLYDTRQQLRVSGPSDWPLVEDTLWLLLSRTFSALTSTCSSHPRCSFSFWKFKTKTSFLLIISSLCFLSLLNPQCTVTDIPLPSFHRVHQLHCFHWLLTYHCSALHSHLSCIYTSKQTLQI